MLVLNRIKTGHLLYLAFLGLCIIIYMNFNGIASLLYRMSAPFSIIILPLCMLIIMLLVNKIKLSVMMKIYFVFMTSYLFIAICTALLYSEDHFHKHNYFFNIRAYLPSYITVFTFYLIYKYVFVQKRVLLFFRTLFICSFITTSLIALAEPLGLASDVFTYATGNAVAGVRDAGLFKNPNIAGFHANMTLVFALFMYLFDKRGLSWLYLASAPLCVYSVVVTFSKASIITAVLIILAYFYYTFFRLLKVRKGSRGRAILIGIVLVAGVVVGAARFFTWYDGLSKSQKLRVEQAILIVQGQLDEETTTTRSQGWELAYYRILKRPIFGNGLGRMHNMEGYEGGLGVHNVYLMILGESGIFPLILLLSMIFYFFYKGHFVFTESGFSFLIGGLLIVLAIQLFGSGAVGLRNQEANGLLGLLIAITSFKQLNI